MSWVQIPFPAPESGTNRTPRRDLNHGAAFGRLPADDRRDLGRSGAVHAELAPCRATCAPRDNCRRSRSFVILKGSTPHRRMPHDSLAAAVIFSPPCESRLHANNQTSCVVDFALIALQTGGSCVSAQAPRVFVQGGSDPPAPALTFHLDAQPPLLSADARWPDGSRLRASNRRCPRLPRRGQQSGSVRGFAAVNEPVTRLSASSVRSGVPAAVSGGPGAGTRDRSLFCMRTLRSPATRCTD